MKLHISAQMKTPGSTTAFSLEEACEDIGYGGRTIRFAAPVEAAGSCVYDGEGFTLRGELRTALHAECAKCLKAFVEPLCFAFEERFEKAADEDEGIYAYSGEDLELSDMIRDNILLQLPISSVCSEDCKGLCPYCGCDRNRAQCDCAKEEAAEETPRRPLAALGALLNGEKEV